MTEHKVLSRDEWTDAREELLVREKEHTRLGDELARQRGELPPIARQNATATGTDVPAYISEVDGMSAFTLQDGAVYQTYAAGGRGVEFLMGFYPILDRMPKGRDEGDAFQTWIRRHDEYEQIPGGGCRRDHHERGE